jgi:hypothetical protein
VTSNERTADLELPIAGAKSASLELKRMKRDTNLQERSTEVLRARMKTVCAFLNSGGGTLMIGSVARQNLTGPEGDLEDFPDDSDARFPMSRASEAAANRAGPPSITGLGPVRRASAPKTGSKTTSAPS